MATKSNKKQSNSGGNVPRSENSNSGGNVPKSGNSNSSNGSNSSGTSDEGQRNGNQGTHNSTDAKERMSEGGKKGGANSHNNDGIANSGNSGQVMDGDKTDDSGQSVRSRNTGLTPDEVKEAQSIGGQHSHMHDGEDKPDDERSEHLREIKGEANERFKGRMAAINSGEEIPEEFALRVQHDPGLDADPSKYSESGAYKVNRSSQDEDSKNNVDQGEGQSSPSQTSR